MGNCNQLVTLTLPECYIGDDIRHFAQVLRNNSVLLRIDLGMNGIGPQGARDIAEAMRRNYVLQEISLRYNEIGVDGAREIAEVLRINSYLREIDLFNNEIGVDGDLCFNGIWS